MLDVDAGQRAGLGIQRGSPIKRVCHRQNGIAGTVEIEREIAATLQLVHAKDLTETIFQIDVEELHV